jgi:hypothetical protein
MGTGGGDIDHSFRQICNVASPLPLVSFLPVTERGVQNFVAADIRTSIAAVLEPQKGKPQVEGSR